MLDRWCLAYRRMALRFFDWCDRQLDWSNRQADGRLFALHFLALMYIALILIFLVSFFVVSLPWLAYFWLRKPSLNRRFGHGGPFRVPVHWDEIIRNAKIRDNVEKVNWKRDGF